MEAAEIISAALGAAIPPLEPDASGQLSAADLRVSRTRPKPGLAGLRYRSARSESAALRCMTMVSGLAGPTMWCGERDGSITIRDPTTGAVRRPRRWAHWERQVNEDGWIEAFRGDDAASGRGSMVGGGKQRTTQEAVQEFCWSLLQVARGGGLQGERRQVNQQLGSDSTVWVGTSKGLIRVMHPVSLARVGTLAAHTGGVHCMVQAGGYVYSGSNDFVVRLCPPLPHTLPVRSSNGTCAPGIRSGGSRITLGACAACVCFRAVFSPGAMTAASRWAVWRAKPERQGQVHDLETAERLQVWKGHAGGVLAMASPGDRSAEMWSGGADCAIRCWEWSDGTSKRVLTGHTGHVTALQLLRALGLMLSGSMDKSIRVWDVAGQCLQVLEHHKGYISGLAPAQRLEKHQVWSISGSDKTLNVFELQRGLPSEGLETSRLELTEEDSATRLAQRVRMLREENDTLLERVVELEDAAKRRSDAEHLELIRTRGINEDVEERLSIEQDTRAEAIQKAVRHLQVERDEHVQALAEQREHHELSAKAAKQQTDKLEALIKERDERLHKAGQEAAEADGQMQRLAGEVRRLEACVCAYEQSESLWAGKQKVWQDCENAWLAEQKQWHERLAEYENTAKAAADRVHRLAQEREELSSVAAMAEQKYDLKQASAVALEGAYRDQLTQLEGDLTAARSKCEKQQHGSVEAMSAAEAAIACFKQQLMKSEQALAAARQKCDSQQQATRDAMALAESAFEEQLMRTEAADTYKAERLKANAELAGLRRKDAESQEQIAQLVDKVDVLEMAYSQLEREHESLISQKSQVQLAQSGRRGSMGSPVQKGEGTNKLRAELTKARLKSEKLEAALKEIEDQFVDNNTGETGVAPRLAFITHVWELAKGVDRCRKMCQQLAMVHLKNMPDYARSMIQEMVDELFAMLKGTKESARNTISRFLTDEEKLHLGAPLLLFGGGRGTEPAEDWNQSPNASPNK